MIVDDDSRNIFAMKATLRAKGYNCIEFADGRDALTCLAGNTEVAAVLLDMMMPELDGYEMIPIIRGIKNRCDMPVLAVTAQAMSGDRERCLAAGANGYISKPVDVDYLFHLLASMGC